MRHSILRPRETFRRATAIRGLRKDRKVAFPIGLEQQALPIASPDGETVATADRELLW